MRLSAKLEYRIAAQQAALWANIAIRDRDWLSGYDPYGIPREVRARTATFAQKQARRYAADARMYANWWANEIRQGRGRS